MRLELSGAAHDALALPFPAERRFEVDLPSAAFLRVSPALVTEQNVRRARVSFRVMVETENDSVEVFDEVFRFGDANRWHSRVVDLSLWSEQRVVLVLVTRTPEDRNVDILWADRIQAVWGEVALVSSPERMLVKAAGDLTLDAESWLLERGGDKCPSTSVLHDPPGRGLPHHGLPLVQGTVMDRRCRGRLRPVGVRP